MRAGGLVLAVALLASACTRTAVEPLGRPYIRPLPDAPEPGVPTRRQPVGTPLEGDAAAALPRPGAPGLAVTRNADVLRFLDRYTDGDRESVAVWLARRAAWEAMIRARLAAAGVPADMLHLALVESGYDPAARSRADAVGMWQFIPGTARAMGLEVSTWIDDRLDPVRATEAAARHLAELHEQFGSWYLAAAAYNGGAGRVQRALEDAAGGARGADSLFWVIQPLLPRETREYVPRLVAASLVGNDPAAFGYAVHAPLPPPATDTVLVSEGVELGRVARLAGVDEGTVRALNARYVRGATPPGRTAPLLLPRGTGAAFLAALIAAPSEEGVATAAGDGATSHHEVRAGETPWSIARRYGLDVDALLTWNGLEPGDVIRPGDRLRLLPPDH